MEKYLRIEMPDGSKWDVPANIIADNRAKYYADKESTSKNPYDKIYKEEFEITMEKGDDNYYELKDWASNNMDWKYVSDKAIKVGTPNEKDVDYQEGWMNGEKEVVER